MAEQLRRLTVADSAAIWELLNRNFVENVFIRERMYRHCLSRGEQMWGFFRGGELTTLFYYHAMAVIAGEDLAACDAFAAQVGPVRAVNSIMGPASATMRLYLALLDTYPDSAWYGQRDVRHTQPMMVLEHPAHAYPHPDVVRLTEDDYELYFPAAVAMYREELGIDPLEDRRSYENYLRAIVRAGKAYGIVGDDELIFKADIGPATSSVAQLQGVWVHPDHRGRGIGRHGCAAVVNQCLRDHGSVSLYVNEYNVAAMQVYRSLGFQQVSTYATVLYR